MPIAEAVLDNILAKESKELDTFCVLKDEECGECGVACSVQGRESLASRC